jgi:hypothetical protein
LHRQPLIALPAFVYKTLQIRRPLRLLKFKQWHVILCMFFSKFFIYQNHLIMPRNTATKTAVKRTGSTSKTASKSGGASSSRRSGSTAMKSDETMLNELFVDELRIFIGRKNI